MDATGASEKLDRKVIITGLVVISGLIMVLLDTTIVNVALDTLSRDLSAPLTTAQWIVTGYLLAVGIAIPMTGWAMDRFGGKRVWLTAVVMFTGGSALCAMSWSMESLIAFRIVQGLGGGMLLPAGQALIARAAGPARLGRAMALLGVPMLLGPVFGPVIGGLLVEHVSWHWIFIVNLPVGALAVLLAIWKLPGGGRVPDSGRLDVPGLVLLSGGLVGLLYGLSEAASRGGFAELGVLGWMIAGAVGLALYTAYSLRRKAAAIIDVRLFGNLRFTGGAVTVFLMAIGLFGSMLLLPLYYQTVRLEDPVDAGLLLAPQGLGAMIAMPLAGRLTDRLGAGVVVPIGIGLALLGTLPLAEIGADTSYGWLTAALVVRGFGLGATLMPAMAAAYSQLSTAIVSRAAPTVSALQQLGGSVGSALLVTVLSHRVTDELEQAGMAAGGEDGASQLTDLPREAMATVAPLLAHGFGYAFWVAFGLTAAVLLPALLLPRGGAAARASGSGGPPESAEPDRAADQPAPSPGG